MTMYKLIIHKKIWQQYEKVQNVIYIHIIYTLYINRKGKTFNKYSYY